MLPTSSDTLAATFLDERAALDITKNRLPHTRQQDTSTIFVTFRLAGSIPAELLQGWKQNRAAWHAHHREPHSERDQTEYRDRFIKPFETWLDEGHGEQTLAIPDTRSLVSDSLKHFNTERYLLHAYVIMPTHVHVLATFLRAFPLPSVISSWKSFSARKIHELHNRTGALWQEDYFDRIIRDFGHFERCLNYIRRNPEKAALSTSEFAHYERVNPFFNED